MNRLRRTICLISTLGLLVVGSAVVGGGGTASAGINANPQCGDEITTNTVLTADVGPCTSGNGLVIAADNITLNLNGHKVFSDNTLPRFICVNPPSCTVSFPDDVIGIDMFDVSNVTVRNGTVYGFAAGIAIDGGGGHRVTGITARDNQGACVGEDFSTQAIGTYGDGIVIFSSENNRIEGNNVLRNGPFSGISVVANTEMINRPVGTLPTGNVIRGNNVDSNKTCFADIGIRIEGPAATNNAVVANKVNASFQEGIGIAAVNNIDFSGLFSNPPTCQNRGFPNPNLPQCPGFTDPAEQTPGNDNNVVIHNQVTNNGFGGTQSAPRGIQLPNFPCTPNVAGTLPSSNCLVSDQGAPGLSMIVFCQGTQALGPFTVNGRDNVFQGNSVSRNAGSGINVGGCPPTNIAGFPPSPGFRDNRIFSNLSVGNNRRGCGVLPGGPGCGTRPTTPNYDLLDTSNVITCPVVSAVPPSVPGPAQTICASLGFAPAPAAPTPFVGTRVVVPGYQACDNNVWRGNVYGTAFPACTTFGGRQVGGGPAPVAAQEAAPGISGRAARAAEAEPSDDGKVSMSVRAPNPRR